MNNVAEHSERLKVTICATDAQVEPILSLLRENSITLDDSLFQGFHVLGRRRIHFVMEFSKRKELEMLVKAVDPSGELYDNVHEEHWVSDPPPGLTYLDDGFVRVEL